MRVSDHCEYFDLAAVVISLLAELLGIVIFVIEEISFPWTTGRSSNISVIFYILYTLLLLTPLFQIM